MDTAADYTIRVDEVGNILLPAELAERLDITSGSILNVFESSQGLVLAAQESRLSRVYVEPTSACNLACRTCIRNIWDEPTGTMSVQTFNAIIDGIGQIHHKPEIFFGGYGEPLAHPRIVEMVHLAHQAGARVELITNGTLLSLQKSQELIQAGLDVLWVSLDGATSEHYGDIRLGAMLSEVMSNVSNFRDSRVPSHRPQPEIGIVFVAMKRNVAGLKDVLKLAQKLGAVRFMVTNVLPYTEELRQEILYSRTLSDILYLDSCWVPHLDLPRIDLDGKASDPLNIAWRSGRNLSLNGDNLGKASNRCPFISRGSTAVAWDGSLSPCLPLMHDHHSYPAQYSRFSRRYVVGSVNDYSLADLWKDSAYAAFRKKVQHFDFAPCTFCGGCDLAEANDEDCIGSSFPTCGGCLWAQGIIQCP